MEPSEANYAHSNKIKPASRPSRNAAAPKNFGRPAAGLGNPRLIELHIGIKQKAATQSPDREKRSLVCQRFSASNARHDFGYYLQESQLRKCASLIGALPVRRMLDVGCACGDWALLWRSWG